jgi:hypothetical protein
MGLASGPSSTACCGCSCCKGRGTQGGKSCCAGKSCCTEKHDSAPVDGVGAKNDPCCKPIIEAPAPAATASKIELDSHLSLVATVEPFSSLASVNEARPALERNSFSTPPPLDAVIVFLHLTI